MTIQDGLSAPCLLGSRPGPRAGQRVAGRTRLRPAPAAGRGGRKRHPLWSGSREQVSIKPQNGQGDCEEFAGGGRGGKRGRGKREGPSGASGL